MILDRLVFLLSFAMSLVSAADYRTLVGMEIKPEFREVHEPSCGVKYTLASCFSTYCKSKFCAVEFDKKTGGCFTIKDKKLKRVSSLLKIGDVIQRKTEKLLAITKGFKLFGNSGPVGFWPFDNVFKGVNLGTKGSSLDWKTAGLRWSSPGPRGSLKYAKLTAENKARLNMTVGGKRLLSLKKGFTMCLWVKPDAVDKIMPILEESQTTFRWWFYKDKKQRELYVSFGKDKYGVRTEVMSTDRSKWRHIAIVHEDRVLNDDIATFFQVYQNSKRWKIKMHYNPRNGGTINPTRLNLGFHFEKNGQIVHRFYGGMACLSIFDRALSKAEIKIMMNSCP